MTQDLYQTNPTFGAYAGLNNPFNSPYAAMQLSAINPAAYNPFATQQPVTQGIPGIQGIPNYGGFAPQPLQLAPALASQAALAQLFGQAPVTAGWQNPYGGAFQNQGIYNPLATAILQNVLAAATQNPWQQQNPLLNPVVAQLASQFSSPQGPQTAFGQQSYNPYQQHHQHHLAHALQAMGQQPAPFGQFNSSLAPQSWVGQGLAGQMGQAGGNYGQVNPLLAQLAARAFQGTSPWGGI